jgi:hypothetical protein
MDVRDPSSYLEYLVNIANPGNWYILSISMNYIATNWQNFKVSYIAIGGSITFLQVDYMKLTLTSNVLSTGTDYRTYA